MERLVAGLLKAMGYCARVTPKGPDGGLDVIASPDALGLESPRIVAEVKHRKGAMGAPAVRSFIGGLRAGDRGLYVSTGGASPRKPATRPTAPMCPLARSTSTPLFAIMSRSTTRPTTKPEAFSHSPASGGRRRKSTIKKHPPKFASSQQSSRDRHGGFATCTVPQPESPKPFEHSRHIERSVTTGRDDRTRATYAIPSE